MQTDTTKVEASQHHGLHSGKFKPRHLHDVTLPRYGLVFFNHLIGEFDSFTNRAVDHAEAYQKAALLKDIYVHNTRKLTWGDLAALECLLLQMRTVPEIRERFLAIEKRYQEVAPKGFHFASRLNAAENPGESELRARTEVLACEFFRLCMLAMCRESIRARASHRVWLAMGLFMALYFLMLFLAHNWQTISAVLVAGAMGGFISAQKRIQSVTDHGESLVDLIELSGLSGFLGTLWAPISGAIFAVVLYGMFAGNLLSGELFPKIEMVGHDEGVFTKLFCAACGPKDAVNAAKLFFWCFTAGFAERFVPDAISRFISKSQGRARQADLH
jgi:hypothetical protein